jgi:hypothetical protein
MRIKKIKMKRFTLNKGRGMEDIIKGFRGRTV